jgi:hypothetical protein
LLNTKYTAWMKGRETRNPPVKNNLGAVRAVRSSYFVSRPLQIKPVESTPANTEHLDSCHRLPVGYQRRQYATTGLRTAFASLAALATSCG